MKQIVNIIGAGLAGCESAWQLASRDIKVRLFEMKPVKKTPAHHMDLFAELVCSNSLRSNQLENAVGLLKEELRRLNSLIISTADTTQVPAGGALAVDRNEFSRIITEKIKNHPNIEVIEKEITSIDVNEMTVIASGPLTSANLSKEITKLTGKDYFSFFDAAAPIVTLESINMEKAYRASRYGKGDADYINCPFSKDEYLNFYNELINAKQAELKDFENKSVFEGCMPIEVMAKRGIDTMRFGPLKPVGLPNPKTSKDPYAVVQLRQDNYEGTLYNIVGFQTHLKWGEQKRVFRLIPGLENAEFERYGVMHRNSFINSPELLDNTYRMKEYPNIYFAGQITGVEGYVESTASGFLVGIAIANRLKNREVPAFTNKTAIGALSNYISTAPGKNFQPMNVTFGLFESLNIRIRQKKERNKKIAERSLEYINTLKDEL